MNNGGSETLPPFAPLVCAAFRHHFLESGDEREGKSYAARLRFGDKTSRPIEFDYKEVADNRGSLAWGRSMAERTRALARELTGS